MSLLHAQGLRLILGADPVVNDVDLRLDAGDLVGLIGANGAGKSSLLRLLAGLRAPDAGSIHLDGRPLLAVPASERARRLAYLPQGADAHWPISVRDLVTLGRLPYCPPWSPPGLADQSAIDAAMQRCDVANFAARSVTTLSGGERARALLARALAGEPSVLLADEPVAGIDPAHQIAVMELLARRAQEGCATVVVLHDLNLAARFCSRLVLMHAARVVADGPWQEVLHPDLLDSTLGVRLFIGEDGDRPVVAPVARTG